MAVGRPAPTSLAKVGPDNTAPGRLPKTWRAIWCGNRPVAISNPLVAHAMRVPGSKSGLMLSSVAKCVRRHGDQRISCSLEPPAHVACDLQSVGESGVRQTARIAPRAAHGIELDAVASPQLRRMTLPGQLNGECRAPGTGADDCHRFGAWALHLPGPPS